MIDIYPAWESKYATFGGAEKYIRNIPHNIYAPDYAVQLNFNSINDQNYLYDRVPSAHAHQSVMKGFFGLILPLLFSAIGNDLNLI